MGSRVMRVPAKRGLRRGGKEDFFIRVANERIEMENTRVTSTLKAKVSKQRALADNEIVAARNKLDDFYKQLLINRESGSLWRQELGRQRQVEEQQPLEQSVISIEPAQPSKLKPKTRPKTGTIKTTTPVKSAKPNRRAKSASSKLIAAPEGLKDESKWYRRDSRADAVKRNTNRLLKAASRAQSRAQSSSRTFATLRQRFGADLSSTASARERSVRGAKAQDDLPSFDPVLTPQERARLDLLRLLAEHQMDLRVRVAGFCEILEASNIHSISRKLCFDGSAKKYIPIRHLSGEPRRQFDLKTA